jgi:ATP-dependent Clp protease ATP-binding subunit ClpC
MSELKTADSVRRLTATGDAHGRSSLASQVRANPFSVVLLDEFEKAATEVWDLFLQVFDAGRLTDEAGSTVDFRQTIVIVTSNLGSAIPAARGTGFGEGAGGGFSEDRVLRAVRSALRPELVNRFDRVVVFRPLPRDVMRRIVHHEIEAVLGRRGIAHRDWAVEVDEGAVDFLLDRGFTVDLGARPLRRAVERYLLAPLAEAIVTHEAPRGEQFLFVTAGDRRLDVQFVAGGEPAQPAASGVVDVEATTPVEPAPAPAPIARDPVGTRAELRVLRDTLAGLRDRVRTVDWDRRKTALLLQTAEPDFWDRPDRFVVLAEAETMDRTEAKILSAASLLDRLFALARDDQARLQRDPVARLARELLQLDLAVATLAEDGAQDALLLIEADEGGDALARDLQAMYEGWARSAGATCELVERGGEAFRRVLLIEGLGVHRALAAETGIHVLERGGSRGARRAGTVHVAVEPWTGTPEDDPTAFAAHLARAGEERIVRRYQREPTPLVRDGVRRYRTGRLDRVLAGGFDLF